MGPRSGVPLELIGWPDAKDNEGHYHTAVQRLQRTQLLVDEEQKEADRKAGDEEILPPLQTSHGASGDKVVRDTLE